jgi:hypothetical protein
MSRAKTPAFAILRFDQYPGLDLEPHKLVTVTEIVASAEIAEQEVERLNQLNADKGSVYRWQTTRFVRGIE